MYPTPVIQSQAFSARFAYVSLLVYRARRAPILKNIPLEIAATRQYARLATPKINQDVLFLYPYPWLENGICHLSPPLHVSSYRLGSAWVFQTACASANH